MPHLRRTLIKHAIMATSLILGTGTLSACASTPTSPPTANFSGDWYVKWCDRTNPKLDCGGFDISVVQEGNRLCGDFAGALVNLRQIDDGTLIGTAVGNTAVLAVQSGRNGVIVMARAELLGDRLKWKVVDEIRRSENNDIEVIALDDVLQRNPPPTGASSKSPRTCRQITGS